MAITPKVTFPTKLLDEISFCQLASISECDSTIQERLIDIQSDDEVRAIFHAHVFGSSAVSIFQNFEEM